MATFNLKFKKIAKETKGAVIYTEVDDAGNEVADDTAGKVVGTLYMRRSALNGTIPQTLTVTIKE
jgi:hypothetical protein